MVRHFVYGLTCLATIATGCGSTAPNTSGSDSTETTAPDQPDKSVGDSIGDATLTGQVDSEAERQLAARIAREIEGVQDVVNRLEVRG